MIQYIADIKNCADGSGSTDCLTNLPNVVAGDSAVAAVMSIVFGVIAAIAVLIIVLQGIRFILSSGEPQKAADARKGIIYALVGLAVALSAEVVVKLVIGKI